MVGENMKIINTYFDDIKIFEPIVHSDYRGFFMESFNHHIQQALQETFLQDSHSKSGKYVLRGLHYQWNEPMGKLVRVIKGRGLDAVIETYQGKSKPMKALSDGVSDFFQNVKGIFSTPKSEDELLEEAFDKIDNYVAGGLN